MIAESAPKAGEPMLVSKASSLQGPAEGLGRTSPPLSAPSVTDGEGPRIGDGFEIETIIESPAMRPRAPLDLIHSTSKAARVTTRAVNF